MTKISANPGTDVWRKPPSADVYNRTLLTTCFMIQDSISLPL